MLLQIQSFTHAEFRHRGIIASKVLSMKINQILFSGRGFFRATILYLSFLNSSVGAQGNLPRYVWTDSPFTFNSPGFVAPGATSCSGTSSSNSSFGVNYSHIFQPNAVGNSQTRGAVQSQCSSAPTVFSAPSNTTKNLRIQIDCIDKTYDAKGDNKGWRPWDAESSIYPRAIAACVSAGYSKNDLSIAGLDYASKSEIETVFSSGKYSYEYCLVESTRNIEATSKVFSSTANPTVLSLFVSRMQTAVPKSCSQSWALYKGGQRNYDIHLITIFNPMQAEALDYAIRTSR
jgi:hypothetical protein